MADPDRPSHTPGLDLTSWPTPIGHLPRTDLPLLVLGTWYSPFPSTKSPLLVLGTRYPPFPRTDSPLLVLGMHPHPGP